MYMARKAEKNIGKLLENPKCRQENQINKTVAASVDGNNRNRI